MNGLLLVIQTISDFLWGTPMTIALIGTGLYLSIKFKFRYITKIKFHFQNTFGKMFKGKGEGEGTVSGFAAACTAMANTIGVGNIGGVATAITMGGPGAIFWMWISALLGMSTKACEIILGQRYRVKYENSMDEYMCDRSFVMKNALGWKKGAFILAICCFVLGPWTCCVQTESVVNSLKEAFGIKPLFAIIVLGITCFLTIAGGLKRISSVMERIVPFMAMLYILGGIGILLMNINAVPGAVALIFKSAFTPMAGVGGFAGATVKEAMRYGIARGLYSNDAGTGYGIVAHAAGITDHPVRQSSWGWGEVFLDTIVVCSVTALSLILTNSYIDYPNVTSAQLTTVAFKVEYGNIGGYFLSLAITVFAWTTIIGMYYSCAKSVNYAFGDSNANKIATPIYMVLCMEVAIVTNVLHKQFFYCNEQGQYVHGKAYLVTYIFTLICIAAVIINCFINQEEYQKNELRAIKEFLGVALVCVTIQMKFQSVLMTGFGLSLGITILFWALYNPQLYIDSLTGLYSKGYFRRWFPEQIKRKKELHLLMIDLWKLKQVNKLYGVTTGDELLIQIAEYLHKINEANHVFRIHGNRFFVFTTSLMDYETNKDAIMKLFKRPFKVKGERISFSAAICGIINVQEVKEIDVLIDYLEYLVQLKPKSDRTILIQNDQHTKEGFLYEQEVKKYMATAIEEDLFEVYYQPLYDLKEKRYRTMEALSRLRHPSLGMISPEVFIGIAEKHGQIAKLGYLQFRKVCKFIKEHPQIMEKIESIKYNLSPLELLKSGYSKKLLRTIEEFDIPFSYFQFEITETVATEYSEALYQTIADFKKSGIQICLDDFGSGYANLNTVLKLPFSTIKLDRSLLNGICYDDQVALLYKNIVAVMQNLGHKVVAEGVETQEEIDLLKQWGVDLVQGYYYTKPLDSEQIIHKLEKDVC